MNGMLLRPVFIFLAVVALLAASSFAQQASSDASFVAPKPKKTKIEPNPIENPAPYDITGVVAEAFKMKHPLQLVNPLAPRKYGDGHDNVTWDPDNPEKPKGIILFGLQW
jgi:hypothetical protein